MHVVPCGGDDNGAISSRQCRQVCRMSVMSLWMAYNFLPEKPACRWMNNAMDEMSECGKWRMSARL